MKKYFSIFILVMFSCAVLAAGKTRLSDSEISELLVGRWRVMMSDGDTKLDAVNVYHADGRMIQNGRVTAKGKRINIAMESAWKVEKGKLISSLVSIKPRGLIPAGLKTTDTIISINKVEFVFKDGKTGKRETYYRISEQ